MCIPFISQSTLGPLLEFQIGVQCCVIAKASITSHYQMKALFKIHRTTVCSTIVYTTSLLSNKAIAGKKSG